MKTIKGMIECERCGGRSQLHETDDRIEYWFECRYCGLSIYQECIPANELHQDSGPSFTTDNGFLVLKTKKTAYGALCVRENGEGIREMTPIYEPITEERVIEFRKYVSEQKFDNDQYYLTKWSDEREEIILIMGTLDIDEENSIQVIYDPIALP